MGTSRGRSWRARAAWLLAAVVAFGAAAPAPAQEGPGIEALIDNTKATLQDQLFLTVVVKGSQTVQPTLPDLPDFRVDSAGATRQMQVFNGVASTSISYNYRLIPLRTGTFDVGPATVEIDGRTYSSKPFKIRIGEADAQPAAQRDIFLTATVSDGSPYVGQQILYTWRLYRRVRILDPRIEALEFPGFLVEDLGEVNEYETTYQGQRFLVSEFKKALFPQEAGTLTLPPSRLSTQLVVQRQRRGAGRRSMIDDFFGGAQTQAKVLTTAPVKVQVRPLPSPPAGFSGLIGRFDIRSQISRAELKVGESTSLKVTISGSGNAQMIGQPAFPELTGFKVYDNQPTTRLSRKNEGLSGDKTYSKDLVPVSPGELTVPALSLTYFDPAAGSFRTASTSPLALTIAPSDGREELRLTESMGATTGKVAVRILADDILPIYRGLDALTPQRPAALIAHWTDGAWVTGLALPPLAFALFLAFDRRQRRYARDRGLRRRRGALRKALGELKAVELAQRSSDRDRAVSLAADALRGYVGDKLDLEGSALTADEVDRHLRRHGVDEELVRETHAVMARLEADRYSHAGQGFARAGGDELAPALRQVIEQLEQQISDQPRRASEAA